VYDLRAERLVCPRWSRFVSPTLQERSWVKMGIYNREDFGTFLDHLPRIQETSGFRYRNFDFSSSSWLWNEENLQKFVDLCGASMRRLKLTHVVIHAKNFRKMLFFPNSQLEHLEFESSYFYKFEDVAQESLDNSSVNLNLKSFTYVNTDVSTDASSIFTNENLIPFTWNELFTCFPELNVSNM
jgi:hypothetical protein